ncbi:hypothetical protein WJX77_002394 [Trebouxia sp. C0004]
MQTQLAAQLAETEARRQQLEATQLDCRRVCLLDNNTPFINGADAFDRLIPWHVLGAEEPLEADPDEKESSELAKHQAWLQACQKSNVASLERIQTAASRFEQLHHPSASPNKSGTVLERYLLERLLFEDERARLARSREGQERDKLQFEQLKQVSALSQRPSPGVTQLQTASRPTVSNPGLQQPVQQANMWPASAAAGSTADASKPPATASRFRSFSITGRAKPPS